MDPNIVKVVRDFDGNASIFRGRRYRGCVIQAEAAPQHWKHSGFMLFVATRCWNFPRFLRGISSVEQLEQLRWLENGFSIRVVETDYDAVSVDVPADVERVEKLLERAAS